MQDTGGTVRRFEVDVIITVMLHFTTVETIPVTDYKLNNSKSSFKTGRAGRVGNDFQTSKTN